MAERGQRSIDRRSLISALATVLLVSETELTGAPHLGSDEVQSAPHAAIPALRVALEASRLHDPADVCARPVGELAADLDGIKALFHAGCDYVSAGERLPGVLDELHAHACSGADGGDRAAALGTLVEACLTAAFTAKDLGYPDLAHVAALRAEEAARVLGSPAAAGKAAFVRCHTLPRALRTWDKTLTVAERAASELEPHARDGEELCVLGLLTLTAALAAAVLQRGQVMEDWLAARAERITIVRRSGSPTPAEFQPLVGTLVARRCAQLLQLAANSLRQRMIRTVNLPAKVEPILEYLAGCCHQVTA